MSSSLNNNNDDDLFASLGGSLMRDILADLQVDDEGGDASNWLSLEQLEQELSKLDDRPGGATLLSSHGGGDAPPPPLSAASMVVRQQHPPAAPVLPPPSDGLDAWSASLQKFTQHGSLEQDFLNADSARKEQQQQKQQQKQLPATAAPTNQPPPPGLDWSQAEDYDVTSPLTTMAPPGLGSGGGPNSNNSPQQALLTQAADKLLQQLQKQQPQLQSPSGLSSRAPWASPPPRPAPITPQNSVVVPPTPPPSAAATPAPPKAVLRAAGGGGGASASTTGLPPPLPPMPEHAPASAVAAPLLPGPLAIPVGVPVGLLPPLPHAMPPPNHHVMGPGMPPHMGPPAGMPPIPPHMGPGMPMPPHLGPGGMPMPPHLGPGMPNLPPPPGPGMPMGGRPPAWQGPPPPGGPPHQPFMGAPPPPPPPPPPRVFCNPHPSAPSVPSSVLASRHMSSRDISYVVHSMMKPLLLAGVAPTDYDVQYYLRLRGAASGAPVGGDGNEDGSNTTKDAVWVQQIHSRSLKSKEWSTTHAVLGHVAKSNVARPRALISTGTATTGRGADDDNNNDDDAEKEAGDQRQRASLWRARIYCDQAYQAYFAVLANWRDPSSASSHVVQAQYRKLFKCLGVSPATTAASTLEGGGTAATDNKENRYQVVDPTPLQLLLKLEKGRVLVARILEQAVLPPTAMQTLLPALLQVLLSPPTPASTTKSMPPSPSAVDDRLFLALTRVVQTLPTLDTMVECLQAAGHGEALESTCRMQCVHTLLQRGAAERSGWEPAQQERWDIAEANLLQLLSGQ